MTSLCVFCGSSFGNNPLYRLMAIVVGRTLAARGIRLVYGGGRIGLMGTLADAALAAGGDVVGVIPQHLMAKEVGHTGLPDLRIVETMHERKALMAGLADGFIALPGGFGTFEELFEILTWSQLGLHPKPFGLLNAAGFYTPLLALLDHATAEGFIRPVHRELVLVGDTIDALLEAFEAFVPPDDPKWVEAS
ncbi:MAG: TIGR00730 family Rossman fold protein [Fimbriimonas sp.]